MSIMGLGMNSCVIINYPVGESLSTGNILLMSQIFGFLFMEFFGMDELIGLGICLAILFLSL